MGKIQFPLLWQQAKDLPLFSLWLALHELGNGVSTEINRAMNLFREVAA